MTQDRSDTEATERYISTMGDLIEVATAENLEVLLADLGVWLTLQVAAKIALTPDMGRLMPTFNWKDDGKPGLSKIRIHLTPDESSTEANDG